MKKYLLAAAAVVGMTGLSHNAAAGVVSFWLDGAGFTANGALTVGPNTAPIDPDPNCGQPGNNVCRTDPVGALAITGISGAFSDFVDGITNATIVSIVPISPALPRDPTFDPLIPSSLSFLSPSGLSYNNLYFPNGSPVDCTGFPFAGTFVDDYGVAFTLDNGDTVDFWGDGDLFGPGTQTYGIAIVDARGTPLSGGTFAGISAAAPEPGTLAVLGTGLMGLLGWRRRARA